MLFELKNLSNLLENEVYKHTNYKSVKDINHFLRLRKDITFVSFLLTIPVLVMSYVISSLALLIISVLITVVLMAYVFVSRDESSYDHLLSQPMKWSSDVDDEIHAIEKTLNIKINRDNMTVLELNNLLEHIASMNLTCNIITRDFS